MGTIDCMRRPLTETLGNSKIWRWVFSAPLGSMIRGHFWQYSGEHVIPSIKLVLATYKENVFPLILSLQTQ